MKRKRILALVLAAAMVGSLATGCGNSGSDSSDSSDGSSSGSTGKVYYLNFIPEL